jgi:hypothetical protein
MVDVNETLASRQTTYGDYEDVAHRSQMIKAAIRAGKNWNRLAPCQRETLEMISNKIGRIVEGDSAYIDSWHDIAGYSQLVVNWLESKDP